MYTEKQIQTAIRNCLLTLDSYSGVDVVINDWSIFDQPTAYSPYVIIGNCIMPSISYRNDTHYWSFPLILAVAFGKTYKDTEDDIRDYRQEIITLFRTDPYQQLQLATAGEGIEVISMDAKTHFMPWYDPALSNDEVKHATPLFVFQELALNVENF